MTDRRADFFHPFMHPPVFDFHVHIYPEALAPKLVPDLAARFGNPPSFDGTRSGYLSLISKSPNPQIPKFIGALNLPVATRPEQVRSVNNHAIATNLWPVLSLGSIHPDFPEPAAELRRIRDAGLRGIKLHPEYQTFTLDDPRMAPIWRACSELGLLVMLHAGGERVFTAPYRTSPALIAQFLDAYPRLTVAAAHLGGFQMWDESEKFLIGKNIYLDLSHTLNFCPPDQLLRLIKNHPPELLLFGTDAPWQDPQKILADFLALPLPPSFQSAILHDNAAHLLGENGHSCPLWHA